MGHWPHTLKDFISNAWQVSLSPSRAEFRLPGKGEKGSFFMSGLIGFDFFFLKLNIWFKDIYVYKNIFLFLLFL